MSNNGKFYNGWEELFEVEFAKPYFKQLKQFLIEEYATHTIYPPKSLMLNAFYLTAPQQVNVVILGQDPYINPNQAMGLAFSVPKGERTPMSLTNIKREIKDDLGHDSIIKDGDLTPWAEQGVLLLNTVLTVRQGQSNSHQGKGWEQFTDSVIRYLNMRDRGMVFMLWGNNAIAKKRLITNSHHLVLTCAHPSPLSASRGFFGCGHFSKANQYLQSMDREIRW